MVSGRLYSYEYILSLLMHMHMYSFVLDASPFCMACNAQALKTEMDVSKNPLCKMLLKAGLNRSPVPCSVSTSVGMSAPGSNLLTSQTNISATSGKLG